MHRVQFRVKGQLNEQWSEWLEDLTLTHTEQSETLLTGLVGDQAASHRLLAKVRDLGLPLLSVNSIEVES